MTFVLEISAPIEPLMKEIEAAGKRAPAAIARAINRAASAGKTAMTRAIAADTGLGSRFIKDEIQVTNATAYNLTARVSVMGRRVPLIGFKARGPEPSRGKGRGVSYTLPTGRGRIDSAFIATMGSGHRGVFKRVGKGRLPIMELFGPSIPHVFKKFLPIFQETTQAALSTNLAHELEFAALKNSSPTDTAPSAESSDGV